MRIAVLTGGGDCPGLNAIIRAVTIKGVKDGHEIIGIRRGWMGMLEKDHVVLDRDAVSGIVHKGGTVLQSSRTNPVKVPDGFEIVKDTMESLGIDALIAIGGDDTLGAARRLFEMGLKVVGVPKTIDRDLSATDTTIGFDTSINIVMDAIDRLHTTAASHGRVLVLEVMGRHSGFIAVMAGMAGGADYILIPEKPFIIEDICESLKRRHASGRDFSIVVAAEGAKPEDWDDLVTLDSERDQFGNVRLGGIGDRLAKEIEKRTGFETRAVNLGHVQRGGSPTAYDRTIGLRLGAKALSLVEEGQFGKMVSIKGDALTAVDLQEAVGKRRYVDDELYGVAQSFFD